MDSIDDILDDRAEIINGMVVGSYKKQLDRFKDASEFDKALLGRGGENVTRSRLKPGSHRQDMAQDTARTCHDQEFRSENSFNS